MTVKACPRCDSRAEGADEVEAVFGFRRNAGRVVPQSWCRPCRGRTLATVEDAGPFRTILADPAWSYNQAGTLRGTAAGQYETMPLDAICKMPVEAMADDDAVLLLWSTNPLLPDALEVIEAWGFTYKTKLTWVKNNHGPGFWLRSRSEDLLIATRGKPPRPTVAPASVLVADNEGHSRKPRAVYPLAERLGLGPRLELFARDRRAGWSSWGDQLSRTVETALEVAA